MIPYRSAIPGLLFFFITAFAPLMPSITPAVEITALQHLFDIEHGFLQPSDVAVGKDGRIYVVDGVNHMIKVFDEAGAFLFSFGGRGTAPGRFNSPLGMTTDSRGHLYIADTGNRRVQIFDHAGKFISLFPVRLPQSDRLSDPVDLALDEGRRRLYVIDNDNHHILVYSLKDFQCTAAWGSQGEGMQMFNHPFFTALARDTAVLVVDVLNTRVQVWDPNGAAIGSIGEWGVDLGQFFRPKGVCTDKDNRIFVSDSYLGVIQVFNRYGYMLSVAGTQSGELLKWQTPVGITIDDRQRLYVVEMIENRIRVYQIVNNNQSE